MSDQPEQPPIDPNFRPQLRWNDLGDRARTDVSEKVVGLVLNSASLANEHLRAYQDAKRKEGIARLGGSRTIVMPSLTEVGTNLNPQHHETGEAERHLRLFKKNLQRTEERYAAVWHLMYPTRYPWIEKHLADMRQALQEIT